MIVLGQNRSDCHFLQSPVFNFTYFHSFASTVFKDKSAVVPTCVPIFKHFQEQTIASCSATSCTEAHFKLC